MGIGVDGVDGHRLPFKKLGELALVMEAHWDTGRKLTGLQWSPAERSPRRQMTRVETCAVVARGGEILRLGESATVSDCGEKSRRMRETLL